MAQNSRPRSPVRYPLWIIAISLLVIAVCLVLQVVQNRLEQAQPEHRPVGTPAESRPTAKRTSAAARSSFRSRATAAVNVSSESPATGSESEVPAGESLQPVASEQTTGAPLAPAYGGFAPLAGAALASGTGEIVGRVTLHGEPPPETRINPGPNLPAGAPRQPVLTTRNFVVSTNGGLADVVVFIRDGLPKIQPARPTTPLEIAFTNFQIEPYVSTLVSRQMIRIRNRDGVPHNLRVPLSGAEPGHPTVIPPKSTLEFKLIQPELFWPIQCSIHPWEIGYLAVFDHPYAAVTDADGNFKIANVPPGKYLVQAVHKASGTNGVVRPVIVTAGEFTAANFSIEAPRR